MAKKNIGARVRAALRSQDADRVVAAALAVLQERARYGSALTSPSAVRDYLRLHVRDREAEAFVVVLLDARYRVIGVVELFRGTTCSGDLW